MWGARHSSNYPRITHMHFIEFPSPNILRAHALLLQGYAPKLSKLLVSQHARSQHPFIRHRVLCTTTQYDSTKFRHRRPHFNSMCRLQCSIFFVPTPQCASILGREHFTLSLGHCPFHSSSPFHRFMCHFG